MLYIGYLIILDGQSIKKISFGKLPRRENCISRLCLRPLGSPPPPQHPNRVKKNEKGIRLLASTRLCTEAKGRGGGPSRVHAPVVSPTSAPHVPARQPGGTSQRGLGLFRACLAVRQGGLG